MRWFWAFGMHESISFRTRDNSVFASIFVLYTQSNINIWHHPPFLTRASIWHPAMPGTPRCFFLREMLRAVKTALSFSRSCVPHTISKTTHWCGLPVVSDNRQADDSLMFLLSVVLTFLIWQFCAHKPDGVDKGWSARCCNCAIPGFPSLRPRPAQVRDG